MLQRNKNIIGAKGLVKFAIITLALLLLPTSAFSAEYITILDEPIPLSGVLKTEAPGTATHSGGGATVDVSNVSEGYIMARFGSSGKRIKLRITRTGKQTYTYDLVSTGGYEAFPLTSGDGQYQIEVFEQVSGNQYAVALTASVNVKLRDPMKPFLYPSQYINFNKDSEAVKKAASLAQGSKNQLETVGKVYNFVINNVSYDNHKAQTVKPGYLPVVDNTLKTGKGICFDYAALMAAMLRSQGIPTRLEIGYVSGGLYHAWLSTYTKETGWVNDVIQFDGKSWRMMDPTFASGGNAKYVGSGQGYSTKYIY